MDVLVNALIETLSQILGSVVLTLIGVAGTWVLVKIGNSTKLENIKKATEEAIQATQRTVGELQQTLVEDLKAASSDGKLTPEEIEHLKKLLIEKTLKNLSGTATNLLISSGVDVSGLITSAGESFINQLKKGSEESPNE